MNRRAARCLILIYFAVLDCGYATEVTQRNVVYDEGGISSDTLNLTISEYFSSYKNIFEGTVLEIGPAPTLNGQRPPVNLCMAKFRVDRWYATTINQGEVFALKAYP